MTDDQLLAKEHAQKMAALRELPEDVLVNAEPHPLNWQSSYAGELQRRLLDSNRGLIAASDKAAGRLLFATWVLVVLTVVIAVFTIVLVWSDLAHA